MAYSDKFIPTDNLIARLNPTIIAVTDPDVKTSYAGFLSVSAITVYELAIKEIFINFSDKKNKVFGAVMEASFSKLNGRIKFSDLRGSHIKQFGQKYLDRFDQKIDKLELSSLSLAAPISPKSQYGNLLECRHQFVHGGSPTLSVNEVIQAYTNGKGIIHCLNATMIR